MSAHVWRPLKVEGRWNPVLRRQATNASGAYAVRDAKTHQVLYVGESATGALWKTFQRHFQDWSALPEHYYDRRGRKRQRGEEFTNKHPERLEGTFEVTSRGKRTKERADEKAMAAQARWIATMRPSWNRDDGLADDGATAREVRAAQEAQEPEDAWGGLLNPRHSTFVKEAASLPADLKARKPRAPRAKKAKPEVAPAPKPAGYGAVEESGKHKGQTRLFNPRTRFRVPVPAGRLVELGRMTELEVEQAPDRKIHAMRWDYARAPILAYDQRGRLFVVYGAHATGKASAEEDAEYKRSHWGKSPHGRVYSATIAERPLVLVGTSTRITYTTKKGRDIELTDYVHAWGEGAAFGTKVEPPRIFEHRCKSGAGCKENRALCIVGGSYRVTPDGIVG